MGRTAITRAIASCVTVGLAAAGLAVAGGVGNAAPGAQPPPPVTVRILGNGVNMRTSPSPGATVITQVSSGDSAHSYCEDRGTDNYTWVKVYSGSRGAEGWIRGDFARPDGPVQRGNCTLSLAPRYA